MVHLNSAAVTVSSNARRHLQEAIKQAELGAFELDSARASSEEGHDVLDGFQEATRDIAHDTPFRDVSGSAASLRQRASDATSSSERSGDYDGRAVASLNGAVSALDRAMPYLDAKDRRVALVAREQLSQSDELWWADGALGTALAAINGGAVPYIEAAQADSPGQDVSFAAGEIFGTLSQSMWHLCEADRIQEESLHQVKGAIETLRALSGSSQEPTVAQKPA